MVTKKYCNLGFLIFSCLAASEDSQLISQAHQLKHDGNVNGAISHYQQALALNPLSFDAHFFLAHEFFYRSQFEDAAYHYKQALRIQPQCPQLYFNLGVTLARKNEFDQSNENLKKALSLDPNYIRAYIQRAKNLEAQNKKKEAQQEYENLLARDSANLDALTNLAELYRGDDQPDKAVECYNRVIAMRPDDVMIAFNLGCCHVTLGNIDQAVDAFSRVLKGSPHNLQALYNIGYVLKMGGRVDQAIEIYKQVLMLDPQYKPALFAIGMAYLYKGDFVNGWAHHERELKNAGKNSDLLRQFLHTNTISGKTILLRPEGGLGDTLMFIRYGKILKQLGAKTVLVCQPALIPLLSRCPYIDNIITTNNALPSCDDAATLMSLPAIFHASETTIPADIPYIYPDPVLVEYWKNMLASDSKFKIGICWQADVHNDSSRPHAARRGIPLKYFYPLEHYNSISLYSLQRFDGIEQIKNIPQSFALKTFDEHFDVDHGSFMDTAAVIANLDLVICVDTAVAHLAGALGKPVFLLLPFATDWRWIAHRTDSPWYPKMKIFQQPVAFDWASVIKDVLSALDEILQGKNS